jgi:hypothetical protein
VTDDGSRLALRIARGCTTVAPRSWGSSCIWCHRWIAGHEDRAWVPGLGALHLDCLVLAVDDASAVIRLEREMVHA